MAENTIWWHIQFQTFSSEFSLQFSAIYIAIHLINASFNLVIKNIFPVSKCVCLAFTFHKIKKNSLFLLPYFLKTDTNIWTTYFKIYYLSASNTFHFSFCHWICCFNIKCALIPLRKNKICILILVITSKQHSSPHIIQF